MSSYFEKGRGWRFDFQLYCERHRAPRGFKTKRESDDAEDALRRRLMLEHAGVVVAPVRSSSPKFANWAGVYSEWVRSRHKIYGRPKRPGAIDHNISSVLRFFGERPTKDGAYVHETAPYHDLTLADPISDPSLVRRFEEWMDSEGIAGSTRKHYVGTVSQMYTLAMMAEYRDESGAPTYNPFANRLHYKWKRRTTTLTPEQIVAWISQASFHTRIALSIATLNPKFRLANILQLEWSDVNFAHQLIRVWDHKNDDSGKALVSALPAQLVEILQHARERHPHARHVILYRGAPVKSIDESVKSAAIAAGLTWGRFVDGGVTFHSLRHSASTLLARLGAPADRRKDVTGHADLTMELWYTHLFPEDERTLTETLSAALPIKAMATRAGTRARRQKAGQQASRPAGQQRSAGRRPAGQATGDGPQALNHTAGELLAAGGNAGELFSPKSSTVVLDGPLTGLRRGPQKRGRIAGSH